MNSRGNETKTKEQGLGVVGVVLIRRFCAGIYYGNWSQC